MNTIIIATAMAVALSACGKQDVSFATLEEAKVTVRDNALFNAQRFRAENPMVQDWSVVSNGDSTQTNACPQGDGWATLTFYSPDKSQEIKIKCSTASAATGCLFDKEFKGKPFAAEDGKCNVNAPFPVPKIAK
jgi:hypothetical protein